MRFLSPILSLLAVLVAISAITYAIASALPGDTAEIRVGKRDDLTFEARNELVEAERERLGLDQPLPVQFVIWLEKAVQGDFGIQEGGGPVGPAVIERIIPSLELALLTLDHGGADGATALLDAEVALHGLFEPDQRTAPEAAGRVRAAPARLRRACFAPRR